MRAGLTLVELLIAMAIMVMSVAALAALARAVQIGTQHGQGHAEATQHARVVFERIGRMVREATAGESFPGMIVVAEQVDGVRFPDTLVIWHPDTAAVDPDGLPRRNELVIYCPDHENHSRLVEITLPNDTSVVPPVTNTAAWLTLLTAIKTGGLGEKVPLSGLLRSCPLAGAGGPQWHGAVRFEVRLRPSQAEWLAFQNGGLSWDELSWVQGICSSQTALRQAWLRTELQLMPGKTAAQTDPNGQQAIPFLGSAALYYEMHR